MTGAREAAERIIADNGDHSHFVMFVKSNVAIHELCLKLQQDYGLTEKLAAAHIVSAAAAYGLMVKAGQADEMYIVNRELSKLIDERTAKQAAAAVKAATNG